MTDMTFRLDGEIVLGTDVLSRIGAAAAALGKKALIITGQAPPEAALAGRIAALLEDAGVDSIRFDDIPLIAGADAAADAGELARGSRASLIVAVGDPLVQALARTAAALAGEDIYDFLDGVSGETPQPVSGTGSGGAPLPYIAVPTQASDPFLLSPRYLLTDPRDRLVRLVSGPPGLCRAVFMDRSVLGPAEGALAFDGFLAALEAWCSLRGNVLSGALLEQALSRFARLWAPGGDPDGDDAVQAAFLLALGAAAAPPGIGTALAWALSGRFPVERSLISAALLPPAAERLAAARPEKAARAAALISRGREAPSPGGAPGDLAALLRSALEEAALPSRLRDAGLNLDRMASAAEAARNLEFAAHSPWPATSGDVLELLKAAY
jgi:alcohol dehydrogenase